MLTVVVEWALRQTIFIIVAWSPHHDSPSAMLHLISIVISKGLETPAGTRVRVRRVGVGVRNVRPHINPYP